MKKLIIVLLLVAVLVIYGCVKQNPISNCLDLSEQTDSCTQPRSECIAKKVWDDGDYKLCKYHFDPKHCAAWVAIKFKNFEACKNKEIFSGYYDEISLKSSKLQFQEGVDRDYWFCYYNIVKWNNLGEECSKIPFTEESKKKCLEYHQSNQPDEILHKGTWEIIGGSKCI